MFLKLGETYTPSLALTDNLGAAIIDDSPIVIIRDTNANKYWNGFMWQSSEFHIILSHIGNGVYATSFTPDKIGMFQVVCRSDNYSVVKPEIIEVYNDETLKHQWKTNEPFLIKYVGSSQDEDVTVNILRNADGKVYSGSNWVSSPFVINMINLGSNVFVYNFTPDQEGQYSITIHSLNEYKTGFILDVANEGSSTPPVIVNSNSLLNADGSDTTVTNLNGLPLKGVKVCAFNAATREVSAETMTNEEGEWSMTLVPGTYFFSFEKESYVSIGFERSVI